MKTVVAALLSVLLVLPAIFLITTFQLWLGELVADKGVQYPIIFEAFSATLMLAWFQLVENFGVFLGWYITCFGVACTLAEVLAIRERAKLEDKIRNNLRRFSRTAKAAVAGILLTGGLAFLVGVFFSTNRLVTRIEIWKSMERHPDWSYWQLVSHSYSVLGGKILTIFLYVFGFIAAPLILILLVTGAWMVGAWVLAAIMLRLSENIAVAIGIPNAAVPIFSLLIAFAGILTSLLS